MSMTYSATVTLRGVTHHVEVTKSPVSRGRKFEDLSPEEKASFQAICAGREADLKRFAEMDRQRAEAMKGEENHVFYATNVATLSRERTLEQIQLISHMIQSGQADNQKLHGTNGDKATSNYRQYVYWLQQHVKELEGAGQSTLAQA